MSSGRDEMMSKWSEDSKSLKVHNSLARDVEMIGHAMRDKHMDGFYGWGQKQKLYQILWAVESALKDSPTFVGEAEWVKENVPTTN